MPDVNSLLEIFGGTGAALLGISGCIWKFYQTNDVEFHWFRPSIKNEPTNTLDTNWENNGNSNEMENFGNSYNRKIFAKKTIDNKWKINMKKGDGDVFLYKNIFTRPSENDEHYFLRIKLKNAPKNAKIKFCHKCFKENWEATCPEYNEPIEISNCSSCCSSGIHIFKRKSQIAGIVTKEQIGVYFDASDVDYNCTIEEAYNGIKSSIYNIILCKFHIVTIFISKKTN